jgi:hypothetical protein
VLIRLPFVCEDYDGLEGVVILESEKNIFGKRGNIDFKTLGSNKEDIRF